MPDAVDAVLNFVAPDPSRHATSFSRDEAHAREPGRQLEKVLQDGGIRPEHVTVRDARGADGPGGEGSLQDELLNGCGFVLLRQHTAVTDWMDEEHVAEHFYRECVELAQRCLPGATVLALDDHDLRKEEAPGWDGEAPATFAHNDFADNMGERLVAQFPEARGAFEGEPITPITPPPPSSPPAFSLTAVSTLLGRTPAGDPEHVAKRLTDAS